MNSTESLDHPFTTIERALSARGCRYTRPRPDQIRAICPAHRETRASLCVTRKDDRVLLRCFAGCRFDEIMKALGLRSKDAFSRGATRTGSRRVVESYDYKNAAGDLVAQKVRFDPKSFRWRRPDTSTPSGWRWSLDDVKPGLYRLTELAACRRVFCVEGEKAVNLLWLHGIPATCPPSGASRWIPQWSQDLRSAGCSELLVVPDADKSGFAHAEHVAAITYSLPTEDGLETPRVKVVQLPGLTASQDMVDWLLAGHDARDLLDVAAATPNWSPGMRERERLDRRRELTRARVEKYRARKRNRDRAIDGAA